MKSLQIIALIFIVICTIINSIESANCPTACLHLGTLSTSSCSCSCYPAWEGTYCERAKGNCSSSSQPSDCGTNLVSAYCVYDSIKQYCPLMCNHPACTCGYDTCLNGGIFDSSSCTCNCPDNYYGTVCENFSTCTNILTCQNFGTFDPNSCVCQCVSGNFGGSDCSTLTCNLPDPSFCASNPLSSCTPDNFIYSVCPNMCGRCVITTVPTTTLAAVVTTTVAATTTVAGATTVAGTTVAGTTVAGTTVAGTTVAGTTVAGTTVAGTTVAGTTVVGASTSVVTSCNPISCSNGFIFNTATCACNCGTGFSGTTCETYNCATSPIPDNALNGLCAGLTCGTPDVDSACPFKCLCGSSTGVPTTTVVTTATTGPATTTAPATSCQPISCSNGFLFNTNTCACNCGTGFSGTTCETYNCATSPAPDDALGICGILTCGTAEVNGQCPFKCLCGSSTASP